MFIFANRNEFIKLSEMDIVERLNLMLDQLEITKSQFADSCSIPRPTASQILSGRNKKISDEIIAKIHEVYPQVSVMWLMFGEGDMLLETEGAKPADNSIFEFNSGNLSVFSTEKDSKPVTYPEISSQKTINKHDVSNNKKIVKIVVFYSDNSFEEFQRL